MKDIIKIWHISDTHGMHNQLLIPKVDLVIHTGDGSNYRDPYRNEPEMRDMINWYASLHIKHKIYVPGNHDSSIEKGLIKKKYFEDKNIHMLIDEMVEIEGLYIYGTPYTPEFGGWSFMKKRGKMDRVWQKVPGITNILATHGPPRHILDLTEDKYHGIESCGDGALAKKVLKKDIDGVFFGHIHSTKLIPNAGVLKLATHKTLYSNGSCVVDGKFSEGLRTAGNLFEYDTKTKELWQI